MIRHKDSHLDHGLTDAQVAWLLAGFAGREAFFIETVTLPEDLGTVPCGLYGPLMGDPPMTDDQCEIVNRPGRDWPSRLVDRPKRPTRKVTVIAGPHDGHPCVLFTAYGGPSAPQEPADPGCRDVTLSQSFWREHALSK